LGFKRADALKKKDNNKMLAALLATYGLEASDVEPEALARVHDPENDEVGLLRVVRLAATNRQLRRVGLPPLLIGTPTVAVDDTQLSLAAEQCATLQIRDVKEREAIEACGLTLHEFDQTLRGTYGKVVGLPLNAKAYRGAWLACRAKAARECGDDLEAVSAYLRARLRLMAKQRMMLMLGGNHNTTKQKHLK
jgi:hypothetical protein